MTTAAKGVLSFVNVLPPSRLGQAHGTLDSFHAAASISTSTSKEYTLVVVTEEPSSSPRGVADEQFGKDNSPRRSPRHRRILLGLKNRGFGQGLYNSFGGKFDSPEESVEECACRELQEETNITVDVSTMTDCKVGVQHFTFEDMTVEMIVHVFRIHLEEQTNSYSIQGCEEITPKWYEDWTEIPLDNMFADDSLWLTKLLSSPIPLSINGWYHFSKGGVEVNTILHYFMDVQPKKNSPTNTILVKEQDVPILATEPHYTLEQKLFHALHDNQIHSPSFKEFNEGYAFCNATKSMFRKQNESIEVVVDVAGGHGALAALYLVTMPSTQHAIVIDPAQVGGGGVDRAWKRFFPTKTLRYRYECLRTGLPDELTRILRVTPRHRVLVVACHACQHLSEEILDIACRFGVHVAVMPCCQKDHSGGSWKDTSKNLSIPIAKVMDLLLAGKIMGGFHTSHDVRMKTIDSKVTPQNRIIICRALSTKNDPEHNGHSSQASMLARAHEKLGRAYRKAHGHHHRIKPSFINQQNDPSPNHILVAARQVWEQQLSTTGVLYLVAGFALGVFTATAVSRK
jgi:8-oxo-dGTP pyrophosphatase MutT (NUDIX family)